MIIEIQEPTDYTIRVEKVTPSGFRIDDRMCHQGLGFEKMFDCFSYCGMSEDEVRGHFGIRAEDVEWSQGIKRRIIGYKDTPCFQIERMDVKGACSFQGDGVYGCLYVLSGKGILKSSAHEYTVGINDQFFIPCLLYTSLGYIRGGGCAAVPDHIGSALARFVGQFQQEDVYKRQT